jgi:Family of unknown function (DUF5677)
MQLFPDEEVRKEEIRVRLAQSFDVAEAALNFWLRHDKNGCLSASRLPYSCLFVAVGLDVQCCRLFRSVIEECGRCEAYTANILTRSLYETVLGIAFVLAKRVRIIVEPMMSGGKPKMNREGATMYCAKVPYKSAAKNPKHWLSRELRGLLHIAHSYFEKEETAVERMGMIPGLKREIKKLKKGIDRTKSAEYEKAIGPEWTYILRNNGSYSGLSVADLAKVLYKPLHLWYKTVYYFQSRDAHGNNPLQHVEHTENSVTAVWLSSDWDVYEALRTAIGIFLAAVHLLHENIGFGSEIDTGFHSLKRRFKALSFEKE